MDPFLAAHYRGQGAVFDLADSLGVISIRDQMMRGWMMGDRLPKFIEEQHEDEELNGTSILIVGAGVAGMSAAIGLAKQGFDVQIIDRNAGPFILQRDCETRWIDPAQYDWPLDHWREKRFPLGQISTQLPLFGWSAERAREIVINQWMPALNRLLERFGDNLTFAPSRKAILKELRIDPETRLHEIPIVEADREEWHESDLFVYRAIIIARGRGPEWTRPGRPRRRRTVGPPSSFCFRGFRFWESAPFEKPHCGLPDKLQEGTVLISGTGDGSLQDLLRVVTRMKSARDIYEALAASGIDLDVSTIHSAEHRAERALNWSGGRHQSAGYLKQLHNTHLSEIHRLLRLPEIVDCLNQLIRNAPANLILVAPSAYFTCTYALNRVLALLFVEYLQTVGRLEVIYDRRVERVERDNAPNAPAAVDCLGHVWTVYMIPSNAPDDDFTDMETREANVLILRHGLDSLESELSAELCLGPMPRPHPPTHLA